MKLQTIALCSIAALGAHAALAQDSMSRSNDRDAQSMNSTSQDMNDNMKRSERDATMKPGIEWERLDVNNDGYLTKGELMGSPALVAHFGKLDTNHDGKVSPEEWMAWGHHDRS